MSRCPCPAWTYTGRPMVPTSGSVRSQTASMRRRTQEHQGSAPVVAR